MTGTGSMPFASQIDAFRVRDLKVGKTLYGAYYEVGGKLIYLAFRAPKKKPKGKDTGTFFRNGRPSNTAAEADGVLEWAIDSDHLLRFEREGVQLVGHMLLDGPKSSKAARRRASIWIASLETWQTTSLRRGFTSRGRQPIQHHLNVTDMRYFPGYTRL